MKLIMELGMYSAQNIHRKDNGFPSRSDAADD